MAKALYPQAFTDIDPEKTYMDFHEKYLPVKPNGTFFIQLGCGASVCKDDVSTTAIAPDSVKATADSTPPTSAPETMSWWDKLGNWLRNLFA